MRTRRILHIPAVLIAALALAGPAFASDEPAMKTGSISVDSQANEPAAPVCSGTEGGATTCASGDAVPDEPAYPGDDVPGDVAPHGSDTVGDGQVITEPSDEVDGPTTNTSTKRGEIHVLGDRAVASGNSSPQPAAGSPQTSTASAPTEAAAPARTPAGELPFTGVNALHLVLIGLLLLGSGVAVRRLDPR